MTVKDSKSENVVDRGVVLKEVEFRRRGFGFLADLLVRSFKMASMGYCWLGVQMIGRRRSNRSVSRQ